MINKTSTLNQKNDTTELASFRKEKGFLYRKKGHTVFVLILLATISVYSDFLLAYAPISLCDEKQFLLEDKVLNLYAITYEQIIENSVRGLEHLRERHIPEERLWLYKLNLDLLRTADQGSISTYVDIAKS